jgi:hypothetical protein
MSTLKKNSKVVDSSISFLLFLMGIGFIYKFITGSNDEIQVSKVFWHDSRIYHGLIFVLASIMYFKDYKKIASLLVLFDILVSFLYRIVMKV